MRVLRFVRTVAIAAFVAALLAPVPTVAEPSPDDLAAERITVVRSDRIGDVKFDVYFTPQQAGYRYRQLAKADISGSQFTIDRVADEPVIAATIKVRDVVPHGTKTGRLKYSQAWGFHFPNTQTGTDDDPALVLAHSSSANVWVYADGYGSASYRCETATNAARSRRDVFEVTVPLSCFETVGVESARLQPFAATCLAMRGEGDIACGSDSGPITRELPLTEFAPAVG